MKINKKIDLLVVALLIILGCGITWIFNLKPLLGGIIGLVPAPIYLGLREKKNWLKIALAVIILGIMFGLVFDLIVTYNKGWVVPRIVLPFRLFGFYPLFDDILGFMIMTFITVVFYEHFLDDEKNKKISKSLPWLLLPSLFITAAVLLLFAISPDTLNISNVYLKTGLAAIVFPVCFIVLKPKLLSKFLSLSAFFFFVWLIAEITALKAEGWIFPGEYVGVVTIFQFSFPFEELFFWMMCYAATIIAYYEFFIDDAK